MLSRRSNMWICEIRLFIFASWEYSFGTVLMYAMWTVRYGEKNLRTLEWNFTSSSVLHKKAKSIQKKKFKKLKV